MSLALSTRLAELEARVAELEAERPSASAKRRISVAQVLQEVSITFAVPVAEIRAPWRHQRLMPARQATALLARRHTNLSLVVIGRAMSRDHTTVLHHLAEAERRLIDDPEFAARVSAVSERLEGAKSDA